MLDTKNSERAFRNGTAPHSEMASYPPNCIPKRNAVGPKSAFRNGISLKTVFWSTRKKEGGGPRWVVAPRWGLDRARAVESHAACEVAL
jgi:hypothetical protein